jgi:two-component system, NarL family, nitrate/nitrite response regulator NarL
MSERTRVLIAEDHPMFRDALEEAVRSRPDLELVGTAGDGRVAIEKIRRLRPEVALVDMRMPELDGSQVLNAVVRDGLPTRVLFLSTHTESAMVYDLLARGASGYLDKTSSADEVCNAIAAASRGKTVLSETIEGDVLQQIRLRGSANGDTKLTAREHEVLRLVADGLSAPDIAGRLYIEASTVKTHLQNTYEKLGVSDRAAAVAEGMRRGLLE